MQIDREQRLARQAGSGDRRRDRELPDIGREEAAANARGGLSEANRVDPDRAGYSGRAGEGGRCKSHEAGWQIRVPLAAAAFNSSTENISRIRRDRSVKAHPGFLISLDAPPACI